MGNDEKFEISSVIDEVAGWIRKAKRIRSEEARLEQSAANAEKELRKSVVEARQADGVVWQVLLLRRTSEEQVRRIAEWSLYPSVPEDLDVEISNLLGVVAQKVGRARELFGLQRFNPWGDREGARRAAVEIIRFRHEFVRRMLSAKLDEVASHDGTIAEVVVLSDAALGEVGLASRLLDLGCVAEAVDLSLIKRLPTLVADVRSATVSESALRDRVAAAINEVRVEAVRSVLVSTPLDRLGLPSHLMPHRELKNAGISNVQSLIDTADRLERTVGITEATATRLRSAADALQRRTADDNVIELITENRTASQTSILRALRQWELVRPDVGTSFVSEVEGLEALANAVGDDVEFVVVFGATRSSIDEFQLILQVLRDRARLLSTDLVEERLWEDFISRRAEYADLLEDLGYSQPASGLGAPKGHEDESRNEKPNLLRFNIRCTHCGPKNVKESESCAACLEAERSMAPALVQLRRRVLDKYRYSHREIARTQIAADADSFLKNETAKMKSETLWELRKAGYVDLFAEENLYLFAIEQLRSIGKFSEKSERVYIQILGGGAPGLGKRR